MLQIGVRIIRDSLQLAAGYSKHAMDTYNPDQAAAMIGASASTIRNWCKVYASELSTGANPPTGTERRLTQQDVAKLQQVKVWRDDRMPVQEILRLLQAAATANEPMHITIDATPIQTAQESRSADLLLPVALSSIQSHLDATDARIEAVERAVALAEQRQAERSNMLVTGIVIGAGMVLIIMALVLAMGQ